MKSIINALLLSVMIMAISCSQDDTVLEQMEQTEFVINDQNKEVVNRLLDLGYNLSEIKELNDFFLVEGDILYSKDIKDYPDTKNEGANLRHAHTDNLVYPTNLRITVRVDASIPTSVTDDWRTAVQSAIADWNGIANCGVFFEFTNGNNANITVKSDNNQLENRTIASAGFPTDGIPFNAILVNLDFNGDMDVSEAGKRYNMVHELGHTIGFRHTNWDTRGETSSDGANLIPGTPDQDPNSVMNGGTALSTWVGFSDFDQISARYLYPFAAQLTRSLITSNSENNYQYEETEFFLETYSKADYTTRLNLPNNRTVNYQLWELWSNGRSSSKYSINTQGVLSANLNRHYLSTIVSDECGYDAYGNAIGDCYQRWVYVTSLVLQ